MSEFCVRCFVTFSYLSHVWLGFRYNSFLVHLVLTKLSINFLYIPRNWMSILWLMFSPVKKGNYFDMRLVSKTGTKNAVCFAVDRCEEFCAYQAQKSPVKIKTFSVNKKFGNDHPLTLLWKLIPLFLMNIARNQ